MKRTFSAVCLLACSLVAPLLLAESGADHGLVVKDPGAVSRADGLAAWDRVFEVFIHPRCANCHTDKRGLPMWTDDATGETRPHGMNIHAGDSRIGAELLECSTCHATSTRPNTTPHAPPHAGLPWQLAPVEFLWFGQDSKTVCEQVRDPRRNGGRNGQGLIEHITHDASIGAFITWAFDPGGGREPAPGSMQEHLDDTVEWVAAGMPCPSE
ncbi:MAG: hypothetical protein AAGK22_06060 [Acidobacteriota bacterium]